MIGFGALRALGRRVGHAHNALQDVLAHTVLGSADGQLQLDLVGNDVVLGAAVDGADGDDGRVGGVGLTADQRLQVEDNAGRQHDGVDGGVRGGAVATLAAHRDVHRIDVGQGQSLRVGNVAIRLVADAVQGQAVVRPGKAREQTIASILRAPVPISSAGWPMNTSVPDQRSFMAASTRAVPIQQVMCMSWPQACMTPTSRPA